MGVLVIGLVVFLGVHSLSIFAEPWRNRTIERLGEGPFKGIYSLVSLAGLILIVWGYGLARQEPVLLYTPVLWMRHLALVLMLPVFPLLFATYLPGKIQHAAKHPTLLAVKLWASAHLLANGTLADLFLFGSFLAWAVADRISLKRRVPRARPELAYRAENDVIAVVAGLAVYIPLVFWLHRVLIGVSPIAL